MSWRGTMTSHMIGESEDLVQQVTFYDVQIAFFLAGRHQHAQFFLSMSQAGFVGQFDFDREN